MAQTAAADFPLYESSEFGGDTGRFYFDLVRLQDREDIPRSFPHRHGYYHLLWMTRAAGRHMLDFEHYEVRDNTVFFVSPGQLHAWTSSVRPQGYVVNFSTEFFAQMFPRADLIAQFPFYHLANDHPVLYLEHEQHDELLPILRSVEAEYLAEAAYAADAGRVQAQLRRGIRLIARFDGVEKCNSSSLKS